MQFGCRNCTCKKIEKSAIFYFLLQCDRQKVRDAQIKAKNQNCKHLALAVVFVELLYILENEIYFYF